MSERFELIKPHLHRFKRVFSVLDLGSGIEPNQNIGQEIAREFENARVVSIEKDWSGEKFEGSPRTIVLKHEMTAADLALLAECEHFDVVLALNVLHWFGPEDISSVIASVYRLGDMGFYQWPQLSDSTACGQVTIPLLHNWVSGLISDGRHTTDVGFLGHTTQFPGHMERPLWRVEHKYKTRVLERTHLEAHGQSARTVVSAGTDVINGQVRNKLVKQWRVGVNLWNCCLLGMVWPERERVLGLLRNYELPAQRHGDVTPHNFVFDGEELMLVDGFEEWGGEDRECLQETVRKVGEKLGEERMQCLG